MAWVIFIIRPNDESTTVAPSSCAIRATWKAIEESFRTPVINSCLPSSRPMPRSLVLVPPSVRIRACGGAGAGAGGQ